MRKILLPIDGSERSKKAIEWVKSRYSPTDVEITILIVREDVDDMWSQDEYEQAKLESQAMLQKNASVLSNFTVNMQFRFGRSGEEIVAFSKQNDIDTIVMTKSTKSGLLRFIGSVTTHVVKYADCVVVIVPEG